MKSDIELIRTKVICALDHHGHHALAGDLRALADRMEAQSKAEPEAFHCYFKSSGEFAGVAFPKDAWRDQPHITAKPVFLHPASDEVERLKEELSDMHTTFDAMHADYNHKKIICDAEYCYRVKIEKQLSAIRQAMVRIQREALDGMSGSPYVCLANISHIVDATIAPEKQQEGVK